MFFSASISLARRSARCRMISTIMSSLTIVILGTLVSSYGHTQVRSRKAQSGCLGPAESPLFNLFQKAAGKDFKSHLPSAREVSLTMSDGTILRGFNIPCKTSDNRPNCRGAVLLIQGDAMFVGPFLPNLQTFSESGYDVYAYDFRGYGLSGGKSHAGAIVVDYDEIFTNLEKLYPGQLFVYGGSLGGIIALNALDTHKVKGVVIDSSPSELPVFLFCPSLNAVKHVPANARNLLIISGQQDSEVPPKSMKDLVNKAQSRGATIWNSTDLHHIFIDGNESNIRFQHAISFYDSLEKLDSHD
jgi:esterase/lipase